MASLQSSQYFLHSFPTQIQKHQKCDIFSLPRRRHSLVVKAHQTPQFSDCSSPTQVHCDRRGLLVGVGAVTSNLLSLKSLRAEEVPKNYRRFVDIVDGYSYDYPADWRDFDFPAHDSAFRDRYMKLHNVRVRFLPTEKQDIHDMGPIEEYIPYLVKHRLAAPNQLPTIFDMTEKNINGKNYYCFEYQLTSPSFAVTCFGTVAIGNSRYYTQIVVANERRWKRYRNQLKVVADSFRVLDL